MHGPAAGRRSPGHPAWDAVWAAATRLGMVAVIHVGNTASDFAGWADIGWDAEAARASPGWCGWRTPSASTRRRTCCRRCSTAACSPVIPTLTVMLEEMRVDWVPSFVDMLERQARSSPALGDWPYDVSGGDMLRRNVRSTPLPGFGDSDALDVLARAARELVCSSDYPHFEGNADPIELYGAALDDLDAELREPGSWAATSSSASLGPVIHFRRHCRLTRG